ncbi:MAG: O-methyltransferase [Phycisphaerales bacterium]|nr:MAG: O-methyltransferase [Phycisphaerales bacterium]
MPMTHERWERTNAYVNEVYGREDAHLRGLMARAVEAGLPDIAVDAGVGRMLKVLCSMTNGGNGARLALELGTLAGYSGIWIARGLAPGGRLITVEPEASHAAFAQRAFEDAGVGDRVKIAQRFAIDVLPELRDAHGDGAFDFVFVDAIKEEYPDYLVHLRDMVALGGLLVADNALGSGASWWIDDAPGSHPSRNGVDRYNRALAADERFESFCAPIREGVSVALRVR